MAIDEEPLRQYHYDLYSLILGDQDADSGIGRASFSADKFFNYAIELLDDNEEISDIPEKSVYISNNGIMALSAYYLDSSGIENDDSIENVSLSLYLGSYSQEEEMPVFNKAQVDPLINKLKNFFIQCTDHQLYQSLEKSAEAYPIAEKLYEYREQIKTVHLFIITDALVNLRQVYQDFSADEINFIVHIIDIQTLYQIDTRGTSSDVIYDFKNEEFAEKIQCSGIPCLKADLAESPYKGYLAVIPGAVLAKLYELYGTRMLESNVRAYLQNKGKVNRQIRSSIRDEPEKFFAYNNGISAIAEAVEVENGRIVSMKNFQIVNGGQTTASIYSAMVKDKFDLSKISVQMKISELPQGDPQNGEIISNIAKFANSQNKINDSDFFSTHPYNTRLEQLSNSISVPQSAYNRGTKWFFERARGSYSIKASNISKSESKKFKTEYPKDQMFKIPEMAKFMLVWDCRPDIVSKGAQYATAALADKADKIWEEGKKDDNKNINREYFKQIIVKVIIFKTADKLINRASWFNGSYKANIVAYTLSFIADRLNQNKLELNYQKIWNEQSLSPAFSSAVNLIAEQIQKAILKFAGSSNVTQYCKKAECWNKIKDLSIELPENLKAEMRIAGTSKNQIREARKEQKQDNGLHDEINVCKNITPEKYRQLLTDAAKYDFTITPSELKVLKAGASGKLLTSIQVKILKQLLERMRKNEIPVPSL